MITKYAYNIAPYYQGLPYPVTMQPAVTSPTATSSSVLPTVAGALGTAGAVHVGQNAATGALLNSDYANRYLMNQFLSGGNAGTFGTGLMSVASPEIAILGNELGNAGANMRNVLLKAGIDPARLTNEQTVMISNLLSNNLGELAKTTPGVNLLATQLESLGQAGSAAQLRDLAAKAANSQADRAALLNFIADTQQAIGKNAVFAPMVDYARRNVTPQAIVEGLRMQNAPRSIGHMAGEALGNAGAFMLDPIAPAMNIGKRFLGSNVPTAMANSQNGLLSSIGSTINDGKKWVARKMLVDPAKQNFAAGRQGAAFQPAVPFTGRLGNKLLGNYMAGGISDLAYDMGNAVGNVDRAATAPLRNGITRLLRRVL